MLTHEREITAPVDAEKEKGFNDAIDAALPIMEKMTSGTATQQEIDTWNFLDQVAFQNLTLVAQTIFPAWLYYFFVIGGALFALATTGW